MHLVSCNCSWVVSLLVRFSEPVLWQKSGNYRFQYHITKKVSANFYTLRDIFIETIHPWTVIFSSQPPPPPSLKKKKTSTAQSIWWQKSLYPQGYYVLLYLPMSQFQWKLLVPKHLPDRRPRVWTNSLSMPPSVVLCKAAMFPAGTAQPYCGLRRRIQHLILLWRYAKCSQLWRWEMCTSLLLVSISSGGENLTLTTLWNHKTVILLGRKKESSQYIQLLIIAMWAYNVHCMHLIAFFMYALVLMPSLWHTWSFSITLNKLNWPFFVIVFYIYS